MGMPSPVDHKCHTINHMSEDCACWWHCRSRELATKVHLGNYGLKFTSFNHMPTYTSLNSWLVLTDWNSDSQERRPYAYFPGYQNIHFIFGQCSQQYYCRFVTIDNNLDLVIFFKSYTYVPAKVEGSVVVCNGRFYKWIMSGSGLAQCWFYG